MKSARTLVLFILLFLFMITVNCGAAEKRQVFKFGTIPVLQALPLFVASEKGFFSEEGLNVVITVFNSAMEKDIAFTSGQIEGYFGDIMTPTVLAANGIGIKMVATNFNTGVDQRMFAIVASPKVKNSDLASAAASGIATGSNTIAEYLTVRILAAQKTPVAPVKLIDIKSIPIRLQMLLSGQVTAALLPEPLATLAQNSGAKVLADDLGFGLSATILAFSGDYLGKYPEAVRSFLTAVDRASAYINGNPDEVREIMNRACKVPEPLQRSFPIPKFPKLTVPEKSQVMDVYRWLKQKQIVKVNLTYKDLVADEYIR